MPQEPQSVPGRAQPQYPQAPQPGHQQPGYEQPHFGQAPQPGYYAQPGYPQPHYNQAPQPGHQQPGYEQPHFGQAPQPGYYAQPGYTHPGYPQPHYNQAPQPGYYAQPSAQPGFQQPGYPQPGYYAQTARVPLDPTTEVQFSVLTHVLGIFFWWISSLPMFLTYGKRGPFIREHTRNNLNFQLTISLAMVVLSVFGMIALIVAVATGNVSMVTHYTSPYVYVCEWFSEWFSDSSRHHGGYGAIGLGYLVLWLTILAVYVYQIIVGIRAAMAANRGQYYRFPLTINFIKP